VSDRFEVDCPTEDAVLRYLAGDDPRSGPAIERHIDGCDACRRMFALLACTSLGIDNQADPDDSRTDALALGEFLPPGTSVGRYRIVRELGRGGMGVVYEAEDPELSRPVALKVLRGRLADRAGGRLLAEARAMARLAHPNVCVVYDVGGEGGRPYIAMECVRGGTLAEWLTAEPRAAEEILRMFLAAGSGLVAAHAIGVVHRDFKPANVLVDDAGRVRVCDFGLAASGEHTAPIGGTPKYMPPEQRTGGGDARVDQFSFAVALMTALESRGGSGRVRGVLLRARAADPADRFPDMASLLRALSRRGVRERLRGRVVAGIGLALSVAAIAFATTQRQVTAKAPSVQRDEVGGAVELMLWVARRQDAAGQPHDMLLRLNDAVTLARELDDEAGLALALAARGSQYGKVGRPQEGLADTKDAYYRATQIGRDDIAADAAVLTLGLLAAGLGQAEEALRWGRHAEGTLGRIEGLGPRIAADFDSAMAGAFREAGDLQQSRLRLDSAAQRLEAESPRLDRHLLAVLAERATVLVRLDDPTAAQADMLRALALAPGVFGPRHFETGALKGNAAMVLAANGHTDEALIELLQARDIISESLGPAHPNVLAVVRSIASLQMKQGRYREAAGLLDQALEVAPAGSAGACGLHEGIAIALSHVGECAQARPRYRTAIDCWEAVSGPQTDKAGRARRGLAKCAPRPIVEP